MSHDSDFGVISLTVILVLFIYAVAGSFFEHIHFHLIHETGLGILLGILAGGLFYLIYQDTLDFLYQFNGSFFFYILLPIIIFSGGYNLNKRRFFQNFLYISLFGVLGTIITFIFVLLLTHLINNLDLIYIWGGEGETIKLTSHQIMIFSATICATDSVAALTMIKPEKYPKLFSVLFGEGMVNDAVAIILFVSVDLIEDSKSTTFEVTFQLMFLFLKEFIGSLLVGFAFGIFNQQQGFFSSYLFKAMRFLTESCVIEVVIVIYMGYASFTLCEMIELSGVISVLVTGVVMAHYNFYNLSNIGQLSSKVTLQTLSLLCEAFIYVYLGISLWRLASDKTETKASWSFVLLELAICFASRAFSMIILTLATQIFTGRKGFRLSFWELNIVWFAGLIRGSIAYALISRLSAHDDENQLELNQVDIIQNSVLMMVIITTVLLGGAMPFYVVFNLKYHEQNLSNVEDGNVQASTIRQTLISGEYQGGKGETKEDKKFRSIIQNFVRKLDENYIKPWLIHDYFNRKQDLLQQKRMQKQPGEAPRKTLVNPSVRQRSMQITSVVGDVQGKRESQQFQKVLFRSTFQSKFTGNQEVIFSVDVPVQNEENTPSLDDSKLSVDDIARDNLTEKELKTHHIPEVDEDAFEDQKS